MRYLTLLAVLFLLVRPSEAQGPAPAPLPKIELKASAGTGTISVSGSITLPAGWKLSIHTLTVKYQRATGGATLNWLVPVKGDAKFDRSMNMNGGSYSVWGVIDVKDSEGRERQITSETQSAIVQ